MTRILNDQPKKLKQKRLGKGDRATPKADNTQTALPAAAPATGVDSNWKDFLKSPPGNITDKLIVEDCCSPDSKIGQFAMKSGRIAVLRLTQHTDMTDNKYVRMALRCISAWPNRNTCIHSSIPCTGGSPRQYVNESIYIYIEKRMTVKHCND